MAVYFIRDTSSGLIKIGHATDPWGRLTHIQVNSPTELEMLAIEDGGHARERELHRMYANARRRGEWFEPVLGLTSYIAGLPRAERPLSNTRAFWAGFSEQELSVLTGISRAMLNRIKAGARRPSPENAILIQRATGMSAVKLVFGELAEEAA